MDNSPEAVTPLPIDAHERIDQLCVEFEDLRRNGSSPAFDEFLGKTADTERSILFRELALIDLAYTSPSFTSKRIDEYLDRYPGFRDVIAKLQVESEEVMARYEPGDAVGRYTIEGVLGAGAFGTVYLARDEELGRQVAIKTPLISDRESTEAIDRLIHEAKLAAKLDHTNIVRIFDVFQDDRGTPAIVMQYIRGQSLRERIQQGPMEIPEVLTLLISICDAIDYAHQNHVVHRDIEPRNILIDTDGRPFVTDFGLAIHESRQYEFEGESAGSLAYMSPEQARGESHWLDGRSDIWAIGVMMYELLSGRRPFLGRDVDELLREIRERHPKPLRQINVDISPEIDEICLHCLEKTPTNRFAAARDLGDALRKAAGRYGPSTTNRIRRSRLTALKYRVASMVLVILIPLAGALGWWSGHRPLSVPITVDDVSLTVWSEADEFRGVIAFGRGEASPLRTGDKVRLDVTLPRPAYVAILWIGNDGEISPVTPWANGEWNNVVDEQSTGRISLPHKVDASWRVRGGKGGVESILVLIAERSFAHDFPSASLQAKMEPQFDVPPTVRWFDNGRWEQLYTPKHRSPSIKDPIPLRDSVATNINRVADALSASGVRVYALAFPVAAD